MEDMSSESYYNFSFGGFGRRNKGIQSSFYPVIHPTSVSPSNITSTYDPFSYTTFDRNSFSLVDDYYSINNQEIAGVSGTTAVTTSVSSVGGNHGAPSTVTELPEMYRVVDETAWPRIYAYFAVFIVSAIANFCELIWVCRRLRTRASAVNRLFLHLCIADLIVVFMVAAVEVLWRISIGWYAGNFMCEYISNSVFSFFPNLK